MNSHCFNLIQFHWICQILAKFSGVKSERTVSKFRKRKRKFLRCDQLLRKAGAWNEQVSRRSHATTAKKRTKKRDARAECKAIFFSSSLYRRQRRFLSSLLFWSRNFAATVIWRHTSRLYCRGGKVGNNCFFTQTLKCNFTQRAEQRLLLKLKNGNSTDLTLANTVTNRIQLTSRLEIQRSLRMLLNLPRLQSPLLTPVDWCAASWARVSSCLIPYN